jgi:hypothetical protein
MLLRESEKACSLHSRRKLVIRYSWTRRWITVVACIVFSCSIAILTVDGTLDLGILEQEEGSNPVNASSPTNILPPDDVSTNDSLQTPTDVTVETGSNDIINPLNDTSVIGSHEKEHSKDQNYTVNTSNDAAEIGSHSDQISPDSSNTMIDDYSHDNGGLTPPILLSASSESDEDVPSPLPTIGEVIEPSFTSVNASELTDPNGVDVEPIERQDDVNETFQDVNASVLVDGIGVDDPLNISLSDKHVVLDEAISDQHGNTSTNITNRNTAQNESGVNASLDASDAPVVGEVENHESIMLSLSDDKLDSTKCETPLHLELDDVIDSRPSYHCGIWGNFSLALRRRRPNLSILQQLFHGEISLKDDMPSGQRHGLREPYAEPNASNNPSRIEKPTEVSVGDDTVDAPSMMRTVSNSFKKSDNPSEPVQPLSPGNDLVSGLDDIDNLFEGVDPPDELDVGADGASIQEVLMGSATRLVIKRISIVGRFLLKKANQARLFVVQKVVDAAENSKLLEHFRDENGKVFSWEWFRYAKNEFAPLQWLRGDDGELLPIQWIESTGWGSALVENLRNDDGEAMRICRKHVTNVASSVRTNVVAMYFKVESFFDKLFEGPDFANEDLDFKFYSDVSDDRAPEV